MAVLSVRCPVLGGNIARVTDLEGRTLQIICGEYEEATGICRLKREALSGGRLSQLLEHMAEAPADTSTTLCQLREG